jgi:hypothetical protein
MIRTAFFTRYSKRHPFDTIHQTFLAVSMPLSCVIRRPLLAFWVCLLLALLPFATRAADGIELVSSSLESTEEGYRLSTTFSLDLTRAREDALMRGVPLYFTTQVQISRPRWYWLDDIAVSESRTVRISYNLLTRQYRASIDGSLHRNFDKLDDILALLRRPARWIVTDAGALKPGATYTVSVQMALDVAQLPKPIQVSAIGSADWRLSSGWRSFLFKADNK